MHEGGSRRRREGVWLLGGAADLSLRLHLLSVHTPKDPAGTTPDHDESDIDAQGNQHQRHARPHACPCVHAAEVAAAFFLFAFGEFLFVAGRLVEVGPPP